MTGRGITAVLILFLFACRPGPVLADWDSWLAGVERQAVSQGISPAVVRRALAGIRPLARVIELDRRQPEFHLTLEAYLQRLVNPARIAAGRRLLLVHAGLLADLEKRYGVPPAILVALWGIESNYGRNTGDFPVIAALATLAWDGRRADFFSKELLAALQLVDRGTVPLEKMRGSWAGALGGLQFLPSVLVRYQVDYDSDGRVDIWRNAADMFATGARYLVASGWQRQVGWGAEAESGNCPEQGGSRRLSEWLRLGCRPGRAVAVAGIDPPLRLIRPAHRTAWLVSTGYDAVLVWNRSDFFAVAVGMLADRLRQTSNP